MAQKFFSIEWYSDRNGEIVGIVTNNKLAERTFDEIQDYCIKLAKSLHCKGGVRNEYGMKVFDFNWSPSCENEICFSWSSEDLLNEFIKNHTPEKEAYNQHIMELYNDCKTKHPDAMILFRCGDFYETYQQDAVDAAGILGITLTRRNGSGSALERSMAGFPYHALDTYLPRLIRAGKRVAIYDLPEAPQKLVKRGITELVAPMVNQ